MASKKNLTGGLAKNLEANAGNLQKAAELGRPARQTEAEREKTIMFSCRMKQGKLDELRDYCRASDQTITGVIEKAVIEYMEGHHLTEPQQAIFQAIRKSKGL